MSLTPRAETANSIVADSSTRGFELITGSAGSESILPPSMEDLSDALGNGQPRTAAADWLRRREPLDRGWYTGAAGVLEPGPDGDLNGELWVLLRYAEVDIAREMTAMMQAEHLLSANAVTVVSRATTGDTVLGLVVDRRA